MGNCCKRRGVVATGCDEGHCAERRQSDDLPTFWTPQMEAEGDQSARQTVAAVAELGCDWAEIVVVLARSRAQ